MPALADLPPSQRIRVLEQMAVASHPSSPRSAQLMRMIFNARVEQARINEESAAMLQQERYHRHHAPAQVARAPTSLMYKPRPASAAFASPRAPPPKLSRPSPRSSHRQAPPTPRQAAIAPSASSYSRPTVAQPLPPSYHHIDHALEMWREGWAMGDGHRGNVDGLLTGCG